MAGTSKSVCEDIACITLRGDYDIHDRDKLETRFAKLLDERAAIIDLSEVKYFDSTILGLLIGTHKKLADQGGRLFVVKPRRPASQLIEASQVDKLLYFYDTIEEAAMKAKEHVRG